jgi:hypothetical protein
MELKIKEAQKKGAKLVLINSSEIKLARHSDLWIDSRKGTNTYLLNSIIKYFADHSLIDDEFIEKHTLNYKEILNDYKYFSLEDASRLSGADEAKLKSFIEMIRGLNKKIVFIYYIDSTQDKSVNDLKAIANFLLLTGRLGKPGNGILMLREFNNSAAMMEMGAVPGLHVMLELSVGRRLAGPRLRHARLLFRGRHVLHVAGHLPRDVRLAQPGQQFGVGHLAAPLAERALHHRACLGIVHGPSFRRRRARDKEQVGCAERHGTSPRARALGAPRSGRRSPPNGSLHDGHGRTRGDGSHHAP